jgi:hypothetical protein
MAAAIKEWRKSDLNHEEKAELREATADMWASLTPDYQWLKNWEYV